MAEIPKSGVPSLSTLTPDAANRIAGDIFWGEAVAAGDACYIKSDGTVWRSFGGSVAPSAAPVGGGATGGSLAAGTYYAKITISKAGVESPYASAESIQFTVAATNIPRITTNLGALPAGYTWNLYLTAAGGGVGTETLYISGLTGATYDIVNAAPVVLGAAAPASAVASNAAVHGFCGIAGKAGDAATLFHDVNFAYGSALTPGAKCFLSGLNPGGLADAASNLGTGGIGFAVDTTRVHFLLSRY